MEKYKGLDLKYTTERYFSARRILSATRPVASNDAREHALQTIIEFAFTASCAPKVLQCAARHFLCTEFGISIPADASFLRPTAA